MRPISVLDLAMIREDSDAREALLSTIRFARAAEAQGLLRFWVAEHHGLTGVASAATAVLIGQIAAATERIRVGAGGIMLPNHAPMLIAEQFGTLESLFPGRIDLGLGRAPGSDGLTQRALRRPADAARHFVADVRELQHWFAPAAADQALQAVPGAGLDVPLWILGSSTFGAEVAAELGLPYAFASHFAPAQLETALRCYREGFKPSARLQRPQAMIAANVVVAESQEEAEWLFSSVQQQFIRLRMGRPGRFPAPKALQLSGTEQELLRHALAFSFVGTVERVEEQLQACVARYAPDELIVTMPIYDFAARLRSLELAAPVLLGL